MESLTGSETAAKILTKDSMCPTLTVKQRIYGFVICFSLGCIISWLSVAGVLGAFKNPKKYALLFSFANLLSLGATFFLVGPQSQWKKMMKKTRMLISIVLLASLIATIIFGGFLYDKDKKWHKLLIIVLMIIQEVSLFWYSLSFIPFGRTIFKKIFCKVCCPSDEGDGGDSK